MELRSTSFRGHSFQFQCNPEDHSSWWTFEDERDVRDALFDIKEGDVFLDVGAAFGSYALSALAVGAKEVLAWAPDRHQYELLAESTLVNGWLSKMRLFPSGLYDRRGWYRWSDMAFLEETADGFEQVAPLDDLLHTLPVGQSYFMKIDTEGAEPEILRGGQEFLKTRKPRILVENHDFLRAGAAQEVMEYLLSLGYQLVTNRPTVMCSHSLYSPA